MHRLILIIGLECYALALVVLQWMQGVRTDEAKYLLNIPYPHPPFLRSIIGATTGIPFQEIFWRVIFATLVVQAVWMLLDLARHHTKNVRIAIAVSWLASAAIVLQAGSIMMVVATALQLLLFVWLDHRPEIVRRMPAVIGLLWLGSLFTAYQAVLFLPLVVSVLRKGGQSWLRICLLIGLPLALLTVYTLSNPLTIASMFTHAGRQVDERLFTRILLSLKVWAIGGSLIVSLLGTVGILRSRQWGLLGSLLLVFLYVFVSRYDYYAILFTPLFLAGLLHLAERGVILSTSLLQSTVFCTVILFIFQPPVLQPGPARQTMKLVHERVQSGVVMISGSFGHEWQYESRLPVERYRSMLSDDVRAVVCIDACPELSTATTFEALSGAPVPVYIRL